MIPVFGGYAKHNTSKSKEEEGTFYIQVFLFYTNSYTVWAYKDNVDWEIMFRESGLTKSRLESEWEPVDV